MGDIGYVFVSVENVNMKIKTDRACSVMVGDICKGKVVEIREFGVFVQLPEVGEGLCHISELDTGYIKKVEDVCKVNDVISVKVLSTDESGRIKLSRKAAINELGQKRIP